MAIKNIDKTFVKLFFDNISNAGLPDKQEAIINAVRYLLEQNMELHNRINELEKLFK